MTYSIGTHISFQVDVQKQPPYIKVTKLVKPGTKFKFVEFVDDVSKAIQVKVAKA